MVGGAQVGEFRKCRVATVHARIGDKAEIGKIV